MPLFTPARLERRAGALTPAAKDEFERANSFAGNLLFVSLTYLKGHDAAMCWPVQPTVWTAGPTRRTFILSMLLGSSHNLGAVVEGRYCCRNGAGSDPGARIDEFLFTTIAVDEMHNRLLGSALASKSRDASAVYTFDAT